MGRDACVRKARARPHATPSGSNGRRRVVRQPRRRNLTGHALGGSDEAGGGGGGAADAPPADGKAALLARMAAAKAYKASSPAPPAGPPAAAAAPPAAAPAAAEPQAGPVSFVPPASALGGDAPTESGFSARSRSPARPDFYTSPDAPAVDALLSATPRRRDGGSAQEMADWMRGVYSEESGRLSEGLNPDMRPEEFAAAREERMKEQGAEIITVDPSYRPEGPSTIKYRPKVSTWGVFERPKDISSAFGGGRNIKPGQELETAEQKAKREGEYTAALAAYRQAQGLKDVDPAEEAAARQLYGEGLELFKRGRMRDALARFEQALEVMPLRTQLGGLATLHSAMCLDALGQGGKAEALYRRIRGHPSTEVSKRARQLVFGFDAQRFLRTDRISYAVDKKEYDPFFRRFADATRIYVLSEEERARDEAAVRRSQLLAAGVVLAPVVLVAVLAGRH